MTRCIVMAALVILVLPLVLFAQGREEEEEDAFDKAFELYSQGKLKEAEAEYRKAVRQFPESVGANLELGRLLAETDRPAEALPFLEAARELAPNLPDPHLELGTAHLALKNWKEAEEHLRKAVRLDPKNEYGWWRLGYVLMKQEKWAEAEKNLQRALRIDEDIAEAWLDLAQVQRKKGEEEEALSSFRRAFETDPAFKAAFEEFAAASEELGDDALKEYVAVWKAHEAKQFGDADRKIRSLIEKEPENLRYHLLLGHVCLHQTPSKTAPAVEAYERCLELEKKAKKAEKLPMRSRSLALEGIGLAHLVEEDFKKAKDAFTRGSKIDPDHPVHSYYLAVVAAKEGKPATVFKRLKEVREKDFDGDWVERAKEDKEFEIYRDRKGFFEALEGE